MVPRLVKVGHPSWPKTNPQKIRQRSPSHIQPLMAQRLLAPLCQTRLGLSRSARGFQSHGLHASCRWHQRFRIHSMLFVHPSSHHIHRPAVVEIQCPVQRPRSTGRSNNAKLTRVYGAEYLRGRNCARRSSSSSSSFISE